MEEKAYTRAGYRLDRRWIAGLDVFNLFDREGSDIEYFYASCLAGEIGSPQCPAGGAGSGVDDIHFHPVEPRTFRFTLTGRF